MSVNGFDFDGTVHRYNYNSLDNIPPNIAPAYSASSTYAVGDYCTKDNVLYKCSTAISTAEAWNSAHWTQVQLATDVADLKDDLSNEFTDVSLWEVGGMSVSTGADIVRTDRIRTGYISRAIKAVIPASGYRVGIYVYNSSDTYIGMYDGSSYQTTTTYWYTSIADLRGIPSNYKIRVSASIGPDISITPSEATNISFRAYTDVSLTQSGKAADAKAVGVYQNLLNDEIPDTVQTYTFSDGSVSQVLHKRNNVIIRTDAFTYGTSSITETRTLNTGDVLTIVTNLTTLETTVSYTAA